MRFGTRPEHRPAALVIYVVSGLTLLGASAISPILPVLTRELGLSGTEIGSMMTAYTLPVVLFAPFVGWTADRFGRRPLMVASLLTFGLSGVLIAFTADYRTILALRVLQGIGFTGISPLTITVLGDLFDGDAEVGAQGLRVVSVNLGGFVFPIVSGLLAAIAWNVPFLLFGLAIPAGLLVARTLPTSDRRRSPLRGYAGNVLTTVRDPLVTGTLALGFVRFFMTYGVLTFLPLQITSEGIGVTEVGLVVGTISGVKVLVASQSRRSYDLGPAAFTMAGALLVSGALIATIPLANTVVAFLAFAAAYGVSEGLIAPLQKSVLTQNSPRDVRASVISINAVLSNAGKTAAPLFLGFLVGVRDLSSAFAYLGVGGALASGLILVAFAVRSVGRSTQAPKT